MAQQESLVNSGKRHRAYWIDETSSVISAISIIPFFPTRVLELVFEYGAVLLEMNKNPNPTRGDRIIRFSIPKKILLAELILHHNGTFDVFSRQQINPASPLSQEDSNQEKEQKRKQKFVYCRARLHGEYQLKNNEENLLAIAGLQWESVILFPKLFAVDVLDSLLLSDLISLSSLPLTSRLASSDLAWTPIDGLVQNEQSFVPPEIQDIKIWNQKGGTTNTKAANIPYYDYQLKKWTSTTFIHSVLGRLGERDLLPGIGNYQYVHLTQSVREKKMQASGLLEDF